MSKNFDKLVSMANEMITCENKAIEEKYGVGYNSNHEFHSVEREEVEEVLEEVSELYDLIENKLWQKIRKNEEITKADIELIKLNVKNGIAELVQVGAVAERYIHGIESGKKEKRKKA